MMIIFSTKYAAIRKLVLIVYAAITLLLVVAAIALALSPAYNVLYFFNPLQRIEEVPYSVNDVPRGTLELPSTITRLAPGDKVSIFLESRGFEQDNLLLEVDYAHCILTIADEPYFEVGGEGTYPEFQREPPFSIDIVALPGVNAGTVMRLDYTLSPINDSLEIKPLYLGDQNLITKRVLMDNYLALLLSVVMLILGVALCIIGMAFLSRAELATALVWLGLTCIACGCWTLFANKVVLLYFSQFSVFYTASLVGLFVLPIPLARFGIAFLEPYRTRLLDTLFIVSCLAFPALLALHVSGLFSLGQAAPWLKSIGLLFLAFYIIFVIVMQQRKGVSVSPLFIFGITLFAVLAFVDGASGYIGLGSPVGTFFMIGLLFATVVIALLVWEYMSDALDALEKTPALRPTSRPSTARLTCNASIFRTLPQALKKRGECAMTCAISWWPSRVL
jgi:hypothetical protein